MNTKAVAKKMKRRIKKCTAMVCALAMVAGSLTAASPINVQAAESNTTDFQMVEGASIRLNEASPGIRFAVEIGDTVKAELFTESTGKLQLKDNVEIGMIIAPTSVYETIGETTDYIEDIEEQFHLTKKQFTAVFRADQFSKDETTGKLVAAAAIVDIKEKNFTREYQAVAYYTTDNGATYHYTPKLEEAAGARSIGYVADAALADDSGLLQAEENTAKAKTAGNLLEKYIKLSNANDLTLDMTNESQKDLYDTFIKGLDAENKENYTFTQVKDTGSVTLSGSTLKAVKEGNANVIVNAYNNLVDLKIPVAVADDIVASFSGVEVYYGENAATGEIISADVWNSYDGKMPFSIGGRIAGIKTSCTIPVEKWATGGAITCYMQMNLTKERIKELLDAGYDKLVIPYYLHTDNDNSVSICGNNGVKWTEAAREQWAEFSYDLSYVYEKYASMEGTGGENYVLRITPQAAGTYELYLGESKVTMSSKQATIPVSPADEVVALIDALPEADAITEPMKLADVAAIYKVKAAFDRLSTEEQADISESLKAKLDACLAKVEGYTILVDAETDDMMVGTPDCNCEGSLTRETDSEYGPVFGLNITAAASGAYAGGFQINKDLSGSKNIFFYMYNPQSTAQTMWLYADGSWTDLGAQTLEPGWNKISIPNDKKISGFVFGLFPSNVNAVGNWKITSFYAASDEKMEAEKIAAVEALIAALPKAANLTMDDVSAVEAAKAAYDALTAEQQAKVTNAAKLKACIAKLPDLQSDKVAGMMEALPTADTITEPMKLADIAAIYKVKAEFDGLSAEDQAKISEALKTKLDACLAKVEGYTILIDAETDDMMVGTPDCACEGNLTRETDSEYGPVFGLNITAANTGANAEAYAGGFRVDKDLAGSKNIYFYMYNPQSTVQTMFLYGDNWSVDLGAQTLEPGWNKISVSKEVSSNVFGLLQKNETATVVGEWKITSFYAVSDEKIAAEKIAAVEALIAALPEAGDLTLDNKSAVNAAKAAYDALTAEQQAKVTNATKLNDCVAKIAELENAAESSTDAKLSGIGFQGWSGTAGLWIDSNGTYAERLSVEACEKYEGETAILHATINHKADGSSDNFKEDSLDMFYTSYAKVGVTKEEVQAWIDAGYTKLRVNYYYKGDKDLKLFANYEGVANNESWAEYVTVNPAEKNKWSYFDIALTDLLYKFDEDKADLAYLIKLLPSEAGTYEFYLGTAKAVKDEISTDAKLSGTNFDAWSGTAGLWIGSNGEYAERLSVEACENYEGETAILHATINHKADGSSDNFKADSLDMFYTSQAKVGVTKEEVQAWIDAGYTKLRVNYYYKGDKDLKLYANYEGVANNASWAEYVTVNPAEKNKWSYFDIALTDVLYKFDEDKAAMAYLIKLLPSEEGTYEFYLGTAKAVKDEEAPQTVTAATEPTVVQTTEATTAVQTIAIEPVAAQTTAAQAAAEPKAAVFRKLTALYGSINGEKSFAVEANVEEPVTGDSASYKATGTIDEAAYAKGGAIKLYSTFSAGVDKAALKAWIEEGYTQLEVPYFVQADNNYGIHVYAMDEKQYSQLTAPNAWNVAKLDLQYLYDNYDRLNTATGDNYLLRVEVKKAGSYSIYLGECKPTADITVTWDDPKVLGWSNDTAIDGTAATSKDDIQEELTIAGELAQWKNTLSISDTQWSSSNPYIYIMMKPDFSLEDVAQWIEDGLTEITLPYYIKTSAGSGFNFIQNANGYGWNQSEAVVNKWSTVLIPLEYLKNYYDSFGTDKWSFALQIPAQGDYELYFGEGIIENGSSEVIGTPVITTGTVYYWEAGGTDASGTVTANVEFHDETAELLASITPTGTAGVISFYYKLGVTKAQMQSWIDEGYTSLKVPYYLEGSANSLYGVEGNEETYWNASLEAGKWTEFSIPLAKLLAEYDKINTATGDGYLFRMAPTAAGELKLAIGQCGVYKETTDKTKQVKVYTDTCEVKSNQIVTNGESEYSILIPGNAGTQVRKAAEELQFFLKEATGKELPIVTSTTGNYFSLGDTAQAKAEGFTASNELEGTDGFQINTKDDNIYIYAAQDIGVVYGVYGYLERTLHYDYYYKDVYTIDKNKDMSFYEMNVTDVPDIKTRIASYGVQDENGWLYSADERLRMRMETYTENMTGVLNENGVGMSFHNSLNYFPYDEYGADHPNWYAGDDKERQICFNAGGNTDERDEMVTIVANKMYEALRSTKYKNYNEIVFALEDNEVWCTCDACQKDIAKYGAESASVVLFCNEVAEKLEKKLRKAKDSRAETFELVFYAYNKIEEAPVRVTTDAEGNTVYSYQPEMKLNYHVSPLYAPIKADFSRSFTAETNAKYLENLKKWNAISDNVHMEAYDSFFNNRGYLLPYNSWDSLQSLYQTAYANGVDWMYNLGQENNAASSGFSLLKAYLESKLTWDVNADVATLTTNFFDAMYGDQADTVKGVYESIKTHMNSLDASTFEPLVNSSNRNNDGHFNVLNKTLGTVTGTSVENWSKTQLENWYTSLKNAEESLKDTDANAAARIRLEEMNILSLLLETQYVKYDTTEDSRSYNTSAEGFEDYRDKFGDIVTEWSILNGAEHDWSMEYYLKVLGYTK